MQANVPLKPGFQTTEFLGVVVSMLVSTLVLFKLLPVEQAMTFSDQLLQFLNICVQISTLLAAAYIAVKPLIVYIAGRVQLKQTQLQLQAGK
jgi:hypothetical protein